MFFGQVYFGLLFPDKHSQRPDFCMQVSTVLRNLKHSNILCKLCVIASDYIWWLNIDGLLYYWMHSTVVCVSPPSTSHLPPHPTPPHPHPLYMLSVIIQQLKKTLKIQHCQLDDKNNSIAIEVVYILILRIWHGYIVAQENYHGFNISNWYFSKYKSYP